MKELQDVFVHLAESRRRGGATALATVFRVSGSTYRRPGARMLIDSDGRTTGCVSGGCLERHVVEQARRTMQTGEPRVLVYDSLSDDLGEDGYGQGCNGAVHVLVEQLAPHRFNHLSALEESLKRGESAVVATIVGLDGRPTVELAQRLIASEGSIAGDVADPRLREEIADEAFRLTDLGSRVAEYEVDGGRVAVFFERIEAPPKLVLFGTGHDATPLVQLAQRLGWRVCLVEHRPSNLSRARRLVSADCIKTRPRELVGDQLLCKRTAVVVMNHNYLDDLESLRVVLASEASYIGVLGPRARTMSLLNQLRTEEGSLVDSALDRVYGPVGLDIGADDPDQIALSIIAEIHAVFAGRSGGSLRDRTTPLHSREGRRQDDWLNAGVAIEKHCGLG